MAVDWTEQHLGELTDNFDAIRVPVKQADRRPGPYPYYGASGIVDHVHDYLFDGEYLLIAEDGENLRTRNTPIAFLADGKFWVNNHAHIVRGNHGADTRFLLYALSELDVSGYLTGSTMPKLTQGNLNRVSLLTPPLPEQRGIAHILGTLDDKIELNRRMNETLEAMARALFKDWFVDFGPTRAKAESRDPYLAPEIWDLFPDKLDEDGKPEGWEVFRLNQIAKHHTKVLSPAATPDTEFEHFSLPAFDAGRRPAIDKGLSIKSNKTLVPKRAVLLSKLNPEIPRVWLPEDPSQRQQIGSTEFLALVPSVIAGRALLFCLFSDDRFREMLQSTVTGTSKSHQRISPKSLYEREVIAGNIQLFARFEELAHYLLAKTLANRSEAWTLAQAPRPPSAQAHVRQNPGW